MSDTRTPDEIERDIERDRAKLGHTVDELQDRFSPDRIMREVTRGLSEHGQDIGEAITQSVKRNPVALAVTGIGLAWLVSGRSWEKDKQALTSGVRGRDEDAGYGHGARPAALPSSRAPVSADRLEAYAASGLYPSHSTTPPDRARGDAQRDGGASTVSARSDDWIYADDDLYWIEIEVDEEDDLFDESDHVSDAGPDYGTTGVGRMSGKAAEARDATERSAASARSRVHEGAAHLREGARSTRDGAAARAHRIRRRLARGTESMGESARDRVISARWAAIKARRATARRAHDGGDAAQRFFKENPLVAGGLALAAGAILAGSLPRTRQEDDLVGLQSDRYYDRAHRTFEVERQKALRVADRAAATAQEVLEEERSKVDEQAPGDKSAAEHVADEVRHGASRVAEAADDEAHKQKLGQSS